MSAHDQVVTCDVRVIDDGWDDIDPAALATRCFEAVRGRCPELNGPVSILFADNATLHDLNARFRGKDKPTNVLSFPAGPTPVDRFAYLGDIALAHGLCRQEADARGATMTEHAAHLLVHAMLHLVGYDHAGDADAAEMESQETAILAVMGMADPYGARYTETK